MRNNRVKAIEAVLPYVVGVAAAAAYYWGWAPRHPLPTTIKDGLSVAGNIALGAFGFMLTAASILVSIKSSWFLDRAKEAGVYASLVKRLFSAIRWCLAVSVGTAIALHYDPSWRLHWYSKAAAIWLLCSTIALAKTMRALRLFSLLFTLISDED